MKWATKDEFSGQVRRQALPMRTQQELRHEGDKGQVQGRAWFGQHRSSSLPPHAAFLSPGRERRQADRGRDINYRVTCLSLYTPPGAQHLVIYSLRYKQTP